MRRPTLVPRFLTALAVIAAAGCGAGGAHEIEETRTLDRPRDGESAALSTRARLRLEDAPAPFVHPPMTGAAADAGAAAAPEFSWKAPDGWTEGPAKQLRVVTFRPDTDPRVECYVTVLAGAAGGLEANVNRWRQQLRLAPLPADAIAKLEVMSVLGRDARVVEIDGGAVGIFGLVCELGERTLFVKMTGPPESLRGERERFLSFCRSLS
jgi:hypothetical protein